MSFQSCRNPFIFLIFCPLGAIRVWILSIVVIVCVIILLILGGMWLLYRRATREWPRPDYRSQTQVPDLTSWDEHGFHATWIGHSTVLLRVEGKFILTDPVFSRSVGVRVFGFTFGPRRHVAPALAPQDLPDIDVVLLSHAHMDHLDTLSLRQVIGPKTEVIAPRGTGHLLARYRPRRVTELSPGERTRVADNLELIAQRVRHWGNRYPWNRQMGYQGYVGISRMWRFFFAGDTAMTEDVAAVAEYEPHLTLMPIGAYAPDNFQGAHCTPEQAYDMAKMTKAKYIAAIHHDTFVLSQEPVDEPLQRFLAAAGSEESKVVLRHHGDTFSLSDPLP